MIKWLRGKTFDSQSSNLGSNLAALIFFHFSETNPIMAILSKPFQNLSLSLNIMILVEFWPQIYIFLLATNLYLFFKFILQTLIMVKFKFFECISSQHFVVKWRKILKQTIFFLLFVIYIQHARFILSKQISFKKTLFVKNLFKNAINCTNYALKSIICFYADFYILKTNSINQLQALESMF